MHCDLAALLKYYGLRAYGTEPQVWGGAEGCEHEWGEYQKPATLGVSGNRQHWQNQVQGQGYHYEGSYQNWEAAKKGHVVQATCTRCGAWRGELGSEPTVELFISHLVQVFAAVRRVLRPDGLVFCNIGDSYAGGVTGRNDIGRSGVDGFGGSRVIHEGNKGKPRPHVPGLRPKSLCLVPERLAIALAEDGWIIRSRIAWCLSGGTRVYARCQKGDMPITVRELARLKPESLRLWNGERWTKVKAIWRNQQPNDPLEIELRSGERIGCTPEHLWPTKHRGLLPASELHVGDVLCSTKLPQADWDLRYPEYLPDASVGWFCGLFLAEGWMSEKAIYIAGHKKEQERRERCSQIVDAFGGTIHFRQNKGQSETIVIYCDILKAVVREYITGIGSKNKRLANACWMRSDEFLRHLLRGYLEGDGHRDVKNRRWRLGFCENPGWAEDLRTVTARIGVHLRLRVAWHQLKGKQYPGYRGEIRTEKNGTPYDKQDAEIVAIRKSRGRTFWDIEVEDEPHTFALASGVLTHNCKRAPMPESVTDRPTSAWEHVWLMSQSPRYFWDGEAIRTQGTHEPGTERRAFTSPRALAMGRQPSGNEVSGWVTESGFANARNYLLLGPDPFPEAHFATFPRKLVEWCVKAGSSERGGCAQCGAPWRRVVERDGVGVRNTSGGQNGQQVHRPGVNHTLASRTIGTLGWEPSCQHQAETVPQVVLDPFAGSGTTLLVANHLGREGWGVELSEDYCRIAEKRLQQDSLFLAEVP